MAPRLLLLFGEMDSPITVILAPFREDRPRWNLLFPNQGLLFPQFLHQIMAPKLLQHSILEVNRNSFSFSLMGLLSRLLVTQH
jgi:hypothetical protein